MRRVLVAVLVALSMPACVDEAVSTEDATCRAQCDGRACGDDGCGGSCGACALGLACDASGTCVADRLCWNQVAGFSVHPQSSYSCTYYPPPADTVQCGSPTLVGSFLDSSVCISACRGGATGCLSIDAAARYACELCVAGCAGEQWKACTAANGGTLVAAGCLVAPGNWGATTARTVSVSCLPDATGPWLMSFPPETEQVAIVISGTPDATSVLWGTTLFTGTFLAGSLYVKTSGAFTEYLIGALDLATMTLTGYDVWGPDPAQRREFLAVRAP